MAIRKVVWEELGENAAGAVYVDFAGGAAAHRLKYGGGKGQMIAKAVGLQKLKEPHVLDATAGLGGDAFVLASLGCRMTLLERSPIVHALLEDGLKRAGGAEVADITARMELINADAIEYIENIQEQPDIIYLDPMFPQRTKSAAVKKEMRIFKDIVGKDEDATELLAAALAKAKYRVVVKRPRKAPAIEGQSPSHTVEGKTSRYDVYVVRGIKS